MVDVTARTPAQGGAGHDARSELTFEDVYGSYFGFVWRSLQRLGVEYSSLEDAAQDVFVVVHRRLPDLRADASPKAFLFAIALRVSQAYRRKLRRKGALSVDVDAHPAASTDPLEQTIAVRALEVVERFVASLDENKRVVFVLTELEQMSAPEIASALNIPVNTVYSRVRQTRISFAAYLQERGNPRG